MRRHRQRRHVEGFEETIPQRLPLLTHARRSSSQASLPGRDFRVHAIGEDLAVADLDDPLRVLGDRHVVRHQDDRVSLGMQLAEDLHHFFAGAAVERAGGLVREDHLAAVHQRARDTHALLLAAGELPGLVAHAVLHAQPGEDGLGTLVARLASDARIDRRHFGIAQRGEIAQQVITLKDESEVLTAQLGELIRLHRRGLATSTR